MGGAAAVTTMLHVVRRTARARKRSLREYVGFITRDTTTGLYLSLTSGKHRKSRNWTIPALETRNFETVNWTRSFAERAGTSSMKVPSSSAHTRTTRFGEASPIYGFEISGFQCRNRAVSRFPISCLSRPELFLYVLNARHRCGFPTARLRFDTPDAQLPVPGSSALQGPRSGGRTCTPPPGRFGE